MFENQRFFAYLPTRRRNGTWEMKYASLLARTHSSTDVARWCTYGIAAPHVLISMEDGVALHRGRRHGTEARLTAPLAMICGRNLRIRAKHIWIQRGQWLGSNCHMFKTLWAAMR